MYSYHCKQVSDITLTQPTTRVAGEGTENKQVPRTLTGISHSPAHCLPSLHQQQDGGITRGGRSTDLDFRCQSTRSDPNGLKLLATGAQQ